MKRIRDSLASACQMTALHYRLLIFEDVSQTTRTSGLWRSVRFWRCVNCRPNGFVDACPS